MSVAAQFDTCPLDSAFTPASSFAHATGPVGDGKGVRAGDGVGKSGSVGAGVGAAAGKGFSDGVGLGEGIGEGASESGSVGTGVRAAVGAAVSASVHVPHVFGQYFFVSAPCAESSSHKSRFFFAV